MVRHTDQDNKLLVSDEHFNDMCVFIKRVCAGSGPDQRKLFRWLCVFVSSDEDEDARGVEMFRH